MRVYTHLTLSEREYLEVKLKEGKSLRWIATSLGRSPSTLSREVRRNWSKKAHRYHHWNANNCYNFSRPYITTHPPTKIAVDCSTGQRPPCVKGAGFLQSKKTGGVSFSVYCNPSVKNQRVLPPPFTQGRL